jgi:hypothetical protein
MTDDNIETCDPAKFDVNKDVPLYKSHKTVRALEIMSCVPLTSGGCVISFFGDRFPSQTCGAEMFARYQPVCGDFYVIYEDGYRSFSPRKAFLEGYTLASAEAS